MASRSLAPSKPDTPPVLLLPGMMLDRRLYSSQKAALSAANQVIIGDITRSDTIEGIARDVLRGAPPRFALVGLSMGGIVALEIWRLTPERVTHLALLDTTPYADQPGRREIRLEQIAAVERGNLRRLLVESMKPLYLATKHRGNARLLKRILAMALALGPEVFRRQSLALRNRSDRTETLRTIDCPALILCGREDSLCPVEFHCAMAEAIPRADLQVLAECGHLSAMEQPEAVTAALRRLLERTA
jgi:pimeloyl-ACP methyl ester carboxylesterase